MPFIKGLFREEKKEKIRKKPLSKIPLYALILLGSHGEEELFVGIRTRLAKKGKNKRTILDSKIKQKERCEHFR